MSFSRTHGFGRKRQEVGGKEKLREMEKVEAELVLGPMENVLDGCLIDTAAQFDERQLHLLIDCITCLTPASLTLRHSLPRSLLSQRPHLGDVGFTGAIFSQGQLEFQAEHLVEAEAEAEAPHVAACLGKPFLFLLSHLENHRWQNRSRF